MASKLIATSFGLVDRLPENSLMEESFGSEDLLSKSMPLIVRLSTIL